MKISIVTLSFNQRAYLQSAIESLLCQGYPELEYIVVDPGSNDGSRELIQGYSQRISRIVFEPDCGAADGLNKGFSFATGEILGFLNADDILMPGSLQTVAGFFQQHPECDIVFGNGHIIDGEGKKVKHIKARNFTVRRYLYGGTRWLQQSAFFRCATFLQSPGFNLANRTCWDGELLVKMANQGASVGYLNADLSGFRIHGASISGSRSNLKNYRQDCRRIFSEIRGRAWGVTDEIIRLLYRGEGLLLHAASLFRFLGKRDSA